VFDSEFLILLKSKRNLTNGEKIIATIKKKVGVMRDNELNEIVQYSESLMHISPTSFVPSTRDPLPSRPVLAQSLIHPPSFQPMLSLAPYGAA
jgi:hypothetical protein